MTPEQAADFRIIKAIEGDPRCSQRQLAKELGISLGKTNFLIHALAQQGLLKITKLCKSKNRLSRIAYVVTPEGLEFRLKLTHNYLELKRREFDLLRAEIDALEQNKRTERTRRDYRFI